MSEVSGASTTSRLPYGLDRDEFNPDKLPTAPPRETGALPLEYPGNVRDEVGVELARQFIPDDSVATRLLGDVSQLQILDETTEAGLDRFEKGYAEGDVAFQQQAQRLIDQGIVRPGTFVLSDTGHDIPMQATFMEQLDMSGALRLPSYQDTEAGNGSRVISQAQTWGNEISQYDASNSQDGVNSYFLGVDGHRSEDPDLADLMPTATELREAGIDRLVYLGEARVGELGFENVSSDLRDYVSELQAEGIEVIVRGVDPRQ